MRTRRTAGWRHGCVELATETAKRLVPTGALGPALDAFGRLNGLALAGRAVECPCCGGRFRRFKRYGASGRPGALCPRCRSFERHRLLWLYLSERTDFFTSELSVLHFAPEYWLRKSFGRLPNIHYTSADLDSPLADLLTDITAIARADEEFDVVLCVHVLEHVVDEGRALSEILRVMKPGGWAIIMVPMDRNRERTFEVRGAVSPSERMRLYGKSDHVRVYGRDFGRRLAEAGFAVKVDNLVEELGGEAARRYGLGVNTDIYLCEKPAKPSGSSREAPG